VILDGVAGKRRQNLCEVSHGECAKGEMWFVSGLVGAMTPPSRNLAPAGRCHFSLRGRSAIWELPNIPPWLSATRGELT
jgi:hypothetical protein